ncbi:MAG: hypothetical protein ACI31D_00250 [Candidatus Limisoma sp.]
MKQLILIFLLAAICSCRSGGDREFAHEECNGVYYWKTVFDLDTADYAFLFGHNVGRIYLRMFDVTVEHNNAGTFNAVVPNASMRIPDECRSAVDYLSEKRIVPVVYVTVEALKAAKGEEGTLASLIVERVRRMCSYNEFTNVEGLQLDCDWTTSTEQSFFALCDSTRSQIARRHLQWSLSSTIRLHQLSRKAPPVDYGVLMVYNTGNFNDPDARNSIIDIDDVEPYLSRLDDYPLHLDVAYPTYSWQLLFRQGRFIGLLNGVNVADTAHFASAGTNCHRAICDVIYNDKVIRKGDVIRTEASTFDDVRTVKDAVERRLAGRPHSNILYHLDQRNLSKYSSDEIDKLYSTDN